MNSRLYDTEEGISDLEERKWKSHNQNSRQKNKFLKMKVRDYCNNIKHSNICIIGVQEGKEREKGIKNLFEEILAKIFPKLMNEKN